MIVLGIDPGIGIMGYGVVKKEGNTLKIVDYGTVNTPSNIDIPNRLLKIFDAVEELITKFKPDAFVIEELFFNRNTKTALVIGQARGVAMLAAVRKNLNVYEYTPLQVKQAVVGYGRAEKKQVQQMVKMLLNLREIPKPDDAADALAISICHINSNILINKFESSRR